MSSSYQLKKSTHNQLEPESKVLFIDNDSLLLGLIEKKLEQIDEFQFMGEENAKIGLKKAKNVCPDIIVLDSMAKGLSGIKLLNELNNSPNAENQKVLVLSKNMDDANIKRYEELGFNDFIEKPFKISELIFRLKRLS